MSEYVDFHHVPQEQMQIHDRLVNWARWAQPQHTGIVMPMFRHYRPYMYPESIPSSPINIRDAVEVQTTFAHIPEKHRHAIGWCYTIKSNPVGACRLLAVSRQGMADLITQGRTMISNRLTAHKKMCITSTT